MRIHRLIAGLAVGTLTMSCSGIPVDDDDPGDTGSPGAGSLGTVDQALTSPANPIVPPHPQRDNGFGGHIDVARHLLVAGAPEDNGSGEGAGRVWLVVYNSSGWGVSSVTEF